MAGLKKTHLKVKMRQKQKMQFPRQKSSTFCLGSSVKLELHFCTKIVQEKVAYFHTELQDHAFIGTHLFYAQKEVIQLPHSHLCIYK